MVTRDLLIPLFKGSGIPPEFTLAPTGLPWELCQRYPITFTHRKRALDKEKGEHLLKEVRDRKEKTTKGHIPDLLFKITLAGWSLNLTATWVLFYAFELGQNARGMSLYSRLPIKQSHLGPEMMEWV